MLQVLVDPICHQSTTQMLHAMGTVGTWNLNAPTCLTECSDIEQRCWVSWRYRYHHRGWNDCHRNENNEDYCWNSEMEGIVVVGGCIGHCTTVLVGERKMNLAVLSECIIQKHYLETTPFVNVGCHMHLPYLLGTTFEWWSNIPLPMLAWCSAVFFLPFNALLMLAHALAERFLFLSKFPLLVLARACSRIIMADQ